MTLALGTGAVHTADDEALRVVLRETLVLLRAALVAVLDADDIDEGDDYGLGVPSPE